MDPSRPGDLPVDQPMRLDQLRAENAELRARLEEAEETLRALREGEVDAIVVGNDLYTLEGANAASNRFRGEALAQMQDAVIATDNEGRLTYLNDAAESLYRLSSSAVLGRPLACLYTETVAPVGPGTPRADVRGAQLQRRADGSEFFVETTTSSLRDRAEGLAGSLIVVRDVTERICAEAAARDREHFVERVMAVAPGILHVFDLVDSRTVFMNEGVVAVLGRTSKEITELGSGVLESLMHPDDAAAFEAYVHRMQRAEDGEIVSHEHRLRHADGTWRWFQSRDAVFSRAADGTVRQIIATAMDITEWRAAAGELARREREFSTLVENSPDVVARFGSDLRYIYVSPAIERYTGMKPRDYLGKTSREIGMPTARCERWEAALKEVFRTARVANLSFGFTTPAGEVRHLDSRLMPEIGSDGTVESVLVVASDVTDRERAEQALRDADRQKDRFLATLAHELRNPLAPISNSLAIMRGCADPALGRQALDVMERQLSQLVRLVDDLLDVNRITHDKLELRRSTVDLSEVIRGAIETSRPQIEGGQHTIDVLLSEQPVLVDADRGRLTQVIANLLNNAAKYSPRASRIEVRLSRDQRDAVVIVKDNGIGIPRESLGRVFEMFQQLHGPLHGSQGGLGIGLALARRLVELHGGTVAAHSEGAGRGVEVTVRIPALPAVTAAPLPAPPSRSLARRVEKGPLKVLIADDNADNVDTLAMLLQLMGCEAKTASDGLQAVQRATEWHPDVAFIDVGMPGLDGLGAARQIRQQPGGGAIVLVAVTGWGQPEDRVRTREAGFDHHLVKPVDPASFEELIGSYMRSGAGSPA